jgi:hypothetical protein
MPAKFSTLQLPGAATSPARVEQAVEGLPEFAHDWRPGDEE